MKRFQLFVFLAFVGFCFAQGEPIHIYGIHDWGSGANGLFNGKSRWDVELLQVGDSTQSGKYQQINNEGFTLILRLGNGYPSVPTNSSQWDSFAASCASTVSMYTAYSNRFIIGNEINANFDANIPPSSYNTIYTKCRNSIKTFAPNVEVIASAVAPQNSTQNPSGPYPYAWVNYFYGIVTGLGNNCDGYAIHAYGGRTGDSDPRDDNYFNFGVYKDWMSVLTCNFYANQKPVYLTEMNDFIDGFGPTPGFPKYGYSTGWINKAYEEINNWNRNHWQKIQCACWFAYTNGGFPGYDLTLLPQASSDFSYTTQATQYTIADPTDIVKHTWQSYK